MRVLYVALTAFLLAVPGLARAQGLVTANERDVLLDTAKGFGSARWETSNDGSTYILGRIDGIVYQIYFNDCDAKGQTCQTIAFRAAFTMEKTTLDLMNTWNRDYRFGRAYIYEGNPRIQMDVNLDFGVSRRNLEDTMDLWKLVMDTFAKHIGFR
jgi:hypothetical protein